MTLQFILSMYLLFLYTHIHPPREWYRSYFPFYNLCTSDTSQSLKMGSKILKKKVHVDQDKGSFWYRDVTFGGGGQHSMFTQPWGITSVSNRWRVLHRNMCCLFFLYSKSICPKEISIKQTGDESELAWGKSRDWTVRK